MPSRSRQLLDRMPVLRHVVERLRGRQPLRDRVLLMIQHQMEDELAQVQALLELGLRPADLHWIDIPYTSRPEVRHELVRMGVPEENLRTHRFPALGRYEPYQLPRVRQWIDERWPGACGDRALVVLDDGGYFLRALGSPPAGRRVAVVEQTLRGIEVVRRSPEALAALARVPLVDVGESRPKKQIEPPAIARSILAGLESDFAELGVDAWSDDWLVVGWGSIGSEVGRLVRARKPADRVAVWDVDPEKVGAARTLGHDVRRAAEVERFGVVIGATGEQTLDEHVLAALKDGALLASVSSASVEFCRDELLARTERFRLLDPGGVPDLHGHLRFAGDGGHGFVLLNGGFPVNFDRGVVDRIPPEEIQFTAALMVHAAAQAAEARSPGIHDVDPEVSDYLLAYARKNT